VHNVQYQSHSRHVTLLAKFTFYSGDHPEWHLSPLQAIAVRVHTVYYRSQFRHVTFFATVTFCVGNHAEWHASYLQAFVVSVHTVHYQSRFVMPPCLLESLSILVTTKSDTRLLCKL
jgi:hypothetical protein